MKNRRRAKLKKQIIEHENLNFSFVSNHVINLMFVNSKCFNKFYNNYLNRDSYVFIARVVASANILLLII